MISPTELETELTEVLPAFRDRPDPTKTLTQNGIDSIDLVDLLCIIQTRYCCDLGQVRIDDATTYAGLLEQLTDIINQRPTSKVVYSHYVADSQASSKQPLVS
jgi:acyl carrier protein